MNIVPRRNRRSVQRCRLVVPAAKSSLDLFVDPMADRLDNFGFDDIALRIDGDFNDNIAHQVARKRGAVHGRVWVYGRIGNVNLMSSDRTVNHSAERRSGAGVAVASFGVGQKLRLGCRLRRLETQAWLDCPCREKQLSRVWMRGIVRGR